MVSNKINYANECRTWLTLKAQGQKVTQANYCNMRSKEIGKTVSLSYFKKKLMAVKREAEPKQKTGTGNEPAVPDQNELNVPKTVRSKKSSYGGVTITVKAPAGDSLIKITISVAPLTINEHQGAQIPKNTETP